jgi:hypothetical protein
MSEKKRQKKDGEDKNKNNQRMREANADVDTKESRNEGREGGVKKQHRIDSVSRGYNDYGDQT